MASASPIEMFPGGAASPSSASTSPQQRVTPKHVQFELLFQESPQYRARLPLRVQIYPHDSTESIVTTVKNFYGLYPHPTSGGKGVSFEDDQGNTLIARYENFSNNMVVYVRVIEESPPPAGAFGPSPFQPTTPMEALYHAVEFAPHSAHHMEQHSTRPASRASRRRSPSPNSARGRRSESVSTNPKKGRSRSSRNRGANHDTHSDSINGYSSGDGAPGSNSGKSKEQIGNTDISVENIVEGGRRKRAKFESSELPLFAPPQMPTTTSNSSMSPARRIEHQRVPLPFVHPGQSAFTHPRPLQSPQSYSNGYGHVGMFATPTSDARRQRSTMGYPNGSGILPTPDPTVGSCMSEEDKDVAIQLMRLGEMSNFSHGRTSASTLDDTFSGKADAASSTGATSDGESASEDELPSRRQKLGLDSSNEKIYQTTESHFIPPRDSLDASGDDADYEDGHDDGSLGEHKSHEAKPKVAKPRAPGSKTSAKPKALKVPKSNSGSKAKKLNVLPMGPMSPASLPAQSRKPSIASVSAFSGQAGEDEQPDLSTKPRCQRCRKSKKGCDRQRPCGRCRDAGLSADQCISEDEGNGRKGRYGRHMGVPIKTADISGPPTLLPAAPLPVPMAIADKNKKRKR
ncbi:hypothetical protein DL764_005547 [Monosporascus ibericus]|uniref:Zn(2)-C6 fungal-type domain-containing protein n=1 Tax=Monosporascus ibericus TaxID=155417 RepID=A0A4Q4TAK2_9PEZI|nr:hypothetical protein DL764_005547 [Monosporascus ibericus]